MSELSVGGYKKDRDDYDFDFSQNQEVGTGGEEIVEDIDLTTPEVEPEIQSEVQPELPQEEPTPNLEIESSQEEPTPEVVTSTPEITDDLLFQHLSEKLGKQVNSFDDLISQPSENPLESDPYLKQLYEWRQKTGRPIEDWTKYQKDYDSMSDEGIVRESLQLKYPTFSKEEIDLEMSRYYVSEYDDDSEAASKRLELKKAAYEGRDVLNKLRLNLETPVQNYSPEVQRDLELAKNVKLQYEADTRSAQQYSENIRKVSNEVKEFKLPLSDSLTIDYKLSDQSRREIPTLIDTMPHWKNQDGSWNHQAVVEDAIKIKHFNDMIKLAYEQGVNSGKEDIIKQTNNVNFNEPTPATAGEHGSKGAIIEGLDEFMGMNTMKIGLRK